MKKKKVEVSRWVRPADVAREFRISQKTVQSWCRQGILPCRKFGPRLWLIDAERFNDLLGKVDL